MLKTEKEVREEIEATLRTIKNYRNAFKVDEMSKESLKTQLIDNQATLDALKWVLGENDRYD